MKNRIYSTKKWPERRSARTMSEAPEGRVEWLLKLHNPVRLVCCLLGPSTPRCGAPLGVILLGEEVARAPKREDHERGPGGPSRMVPGRGLEPPWDCSRQLLRLMRLPFRHPGNACSMTPYTLNDHKTRRSEDGSLPWHRIIMTEGTRDEKRLYRPADIHYSSRAAARSSRADRTRTISRDDEHWCIDNR